MKYRILTGTGARVSRLCMGTMTFGGQAGEAESIQMVQRALDAGISFFDTADVYNDGAAEAILGKALKGHRDGVVVASKVRNPMGQHPHKDSGLSRWHIIHGVEASLKRLGMECLDILYFHQPDYDTPWEESLSAADQLVRQGKVMYIGVSNHAAWQICKALWVCDRNRLSAPRVTQVVYNLLARGIEQELLPFCREQGVGVTVYNPLAAGLLTGKHNRAEGPVQGSRLQLNPTYYERYWMDANLDAVAELQKIAGRAAIKPVALAYRWLAAQETVDAIVVGASRPEQLDENLLLWDGELSADTLEACDRVWERLRGPSYPYSR
jgi:aryl-alcohol dehydrogenase-like predicted oxidoreductase